MPRVPRYSRQEIAQPLQVRENINYTPDQFGPDLSQVASGLESMAQAYRGYRDRADKAAVTDAINEYSRATSDFETRPGTGALNQLGKNAFDLTSKMREELNPVAERLKGNLSPSQQKMFESLRQSQDDKTIRSLNQHTSKEMVTYEKNMVDSFVNNSREAAIYHSTDLDRVNQELAEQEVMIADYGVRTGEDPEVTKNKLLTQTSATRTGVIRQLVDSQNIETAKEYYGRVRDKLTSKDDEYISNLIKNGSLEQEAQENADALIAKHGDNISAALRGANQIGRAELRAKTKSKIMAQEQEFEAAKRIESERNFYDGYNNIENMIRSGQAANINLIRSVGGQSRWDRLTESQRKSLEKLASGNTKPDWERYYDLNLMAVNEATRDEFLVKNLMEDRPYLPDAEWKKIVDLQRQMRSGGGNEDLAGIQSRLGVTDKVLSSRYDLKTKNKKQIEEMTEYRKAVEFAVEAEQRRTGKKMSNTEVWELAEKINADVVLGRGMLWGVKSKPAFMVTEQEIQDISFKDIPRADVNRIKSDLMQAGLVPSEAAILKIFKQNVFEQAGYNGSED